MLLKALRPFAPYLPIPFLAMSFTTTTGSHPSSTFPTSPHTPTHAQWPYTPRDFQRSDPSPDTQFYTPTRLVTHIDDVAISHLKRYYAEVLPREGRVLDLCSSWISHFPKELEELALASLDGNNSSEGVAEDAGDDQAGSIRRLQVIGMGMNAIELDHNPILSHRLIQDLNLNPILPSDLAPLNALTCVVSIDYLTQPLEVLQSAYSLLEPGSYVHLVISNRCFPTKVIRRWMEISERERLDMVGDYLHFGGFDGVEVVTLNEGRRSDPIWVVRGRKALA